MAQRGRFLLKRRAAGKSDPNRVRLAHRVQQALTRGRLPRPQAHSHPLHGNTLLQLKGNAYEMFEFVAGEGYARSPAQTRAAGDMLARFHKATADFSEVEFAPSGDYHDANAIRTGLCAIGSGLSSHDSFTGDEAELASLIQTLIATYDRAAEAVDATGFATWEPRILHADWHPGNLMFKRDQIVAVIDYDSVRRSQRVIDVANGTLQFSMRGEGDPARWPAELDQKRFAAFLTGYHQRQPLEGEELSCLPYLMTEALITECVPPITRTGAVGKWAGFRRAPDGAAQDRLAAGGKRGRSLSDEHAACLRVQRELCAGSCLNESRVARSSCARPWWFLHRGGVSTCIPRPSRAGPCHLNGAALETGGRAGSFPRRSDMLQGVEKLEGHAIRCRTRPHRRRPEVRRHYCF